MPFLGEVRRFAFNFAPRGWATCDGQSLPINQNQALYSLIGTTYGGGGNNTFSLPDLRGRTAVHMDGSAGAIGAKGGGVGPSQPFGTICFCVAIEGLYPSPGDRASYYPEEPYVGEVRLFGGNFAPVGWAICDGRELHVSENETLFNLIGTTYGGGGELFKLPKLSNAVAIHRSHGHAVGASSSGPMGLDTSPVEMLYIISLSGMYPLQ